jgi:pyridinium-3,5-bisthiocarboxylic acid mononucleotide nickel chelatase
MREKVLFIDCTSGASGDMLLGALLDLGVPLAALKRELSGLPFSGFRLARSRGARGGVSGTHLSVVTPGDRGYRHWSDFERILRRSRLASGLKDRSLALLRRLFEAEAEVHGETAESVHLHELGSLDTLIDVAGAVAGLGLLGVSEVVSSEVNVGGGFVETEHGRMTVPAPATALLLEGAPVFSDGEDFERTTPTGALLVTGLSTRFGTLPRMTLRKVGYGLGTKDPKHGRPNALRLVLGERDPGGSETLLVLEATIDDMTPEQMGYLQERLLEVSLDAFLTPVIMKKNRPGVNVTVLARPEARERVSGILFTEGTTLGVRYHEVRREALERRFVSVATRYGKVRVKEGILAGKVVNRAPELEDCRKLASAKNVPLKEVQQAALEATVERRGSARLRAKRPGESRRSPKGGGGRAPLPRAKSEGS